MRPVERGSGVWLEKPKQGTRIIVRSEIDKGNYETSSFNWGEFYRRFLHAITLDRIVGNYHPGDITMGAVLLGGFYDERIFALAPVLIGSMNEQEGTAHVLLESDYIQEDRRLLLEPSRGFGKSRVFILYPEILPGCPQLSTR